jgi:hypothetical protein
VCWIAFELFRGAMTLQAIPVGEWLIHLDLLRHQTSVVNRHMLQADQLCLERTEEAVVHMASVALIFQYPAITVVEGRQGITFRIVQVLHPGSHSVAIGTKLDLLSSAKRQGEGRHTNQHRRNAQDKKQQYSFPGTHGRR